MRAEGYRLTIALLGKGSTNHLHREEVVAAFARNQVTVSFLVRDDYVDVLDKLDGCEYRTVSFEKLTGIKAALKANLEYIRHLYPSQDPGRKAYFGLISKYKRSIGFRLIDVVYKLFARKRWMVDAIAKLEGKLGLYDRPLGLDADSMDQLLLLGVGTASSELEGHLAWWAQEHGVPVVNIIANYDNLTSKGYRGVPVQRLLVWGPNMREDAVNAHNIPAERVTEIGSIRYNTSFHSIPVSREEFLTSVGLDPQRKTILFAGFFFEFHYFEMLEIFDELRREGVDCQLILRIYPNKILMSSVFMSSFIELAQSRQDIYVSIGDPHYGSGRKDKSVLQIEEYELCNSLNSCDCVVNIFSTISLEACMYNKPALNMYYFQPPFSALARSPLYYDYEKLFHSRRLVSYGAVKTTRNREQLVAEIKNALAYPGQLEAQRKATVEAECGVLDGKACDRLVEACQREYGAVS